MIPLWIKLAYTVFALITVVIYARRWGFANFLWFSDIALIVTVPALWMESSVLASMMAVGILLPEVLWNLGFFTRLLTRRRLGGLTDYMFDRSKPLYLRALSLFHVFLPPLLVWMVARLGYDSRALWSQTLLAWVVLLLCYVFTDPKENINSVFGPGSRPQEKIHPLAYLALVLLAFPLLVFLPTHLLLGWLFS